MCEGNSPSLFPNNLNPEVMTKQRMIRDVVLTILLTSLFAYLMNAISSL